MIINKEKGSTLLRLMASVSLIVASPLATRAQIHTPFLSHQQWINEAEAQSRQYLFAPSAFMATSYLNQKLSLYLNTDPIIEQDRAKFIQAIAAISSGSMVNFETINPAYGDRLALAKARYFFSKKQWADAIIAYQNAGIANLDNQEIVAAKFELAYCYFNNKQFSEAKTILAGLRNLSGKYAANAQYYYGLLAYNEGDYTGARASFEQIEKHKDYQKVVPYYIAEIQYFEGKKSEALKKAISIIESKEENYYRNEANLLAAQCLFEQEQFADAVPYFEYYYKNVDKIRKQDLYKMGYCYYRTKQWQKAIEPFQQLSAVQDNIGQTAMYLLGDCYLKTNDKKGARNAFNICSQMTFEPSLVEPSLLLSGKLGFELGYSTEAAGQLQKLIQEFPQSSFRAEATSILSEQLLASGNFEEAYSLLQSNNVPDAALLQKAAFGYAMQKMQQKQWEEAHDLLNESIAHPHDMGYLGAAYFWKAEIYYRNKNYSAALSNDQMFLKQDLAAASKVSAAATAQHALLTAGYSALNLQDYSQARSYFAQAQKNASGSETALQADAVLREADAAFLDKDYAKANELYNKVIALKNAEAPYAQFQNSIVLGLQGKSSEQVAILQEIIAQKNPESKFKNEACYSLGDLHLDANKFEDAIAYFQKINENTAPHLAAKAKMKIAFAYQEAGNNTKAIEQYKRVLALYPNTEQSFAALDALKTLFINNNQPNAYAQLLKESKLNPSDNKALDSVYYQSSEAQYLAGKFEQAVNAFNQYLKEYPQGVYLTQANYYKAESFVQLHRPDSALAAFDAVLSGSWTDFTELSSAKAASIAMAQNNWVSAEKYYSILRNNAVAKDNLKQAYKGLMICAKKQNNLESAAKFADTLIQLPEMDEQTSAEAKMVFANHYQSQKKYEEAMNIYAELLSSKNMEITGEAHYQTAQIYLSQQKLSEAESAANKAIKETSAQPFWNAKAYLLMSDVFVAQKDYFNAKATLQSVVKNVKIETLKKEAADKLEQVKKLEKGKSKLSEG